MSMPASTDMREQSAPAQDVAGDVGFGRFESATGFMLRIAQQISLERFYPHVSDVPATVGEFTVLMTIGENPGIRQGALADVLKIKWPTMTKLVRGLQDGGMLRRTVSPADRRAVELSLTPDGERLVEGANRSILEADRKALEMLSDEEYRQLLHLLRRVVGREEETTG